MAYDAQTIASKLDDLKRRLAAVGSTGNIDASQVVSGTLNTARVPFDAILTDGSNVLVGGGNVLTT